MVYKRDVLKNVKFTNKLTKQSSEGAPSKDALNNFANFTEKHICGNPFFNKAALQLSETVTGDVQ